MKSGIIDDLAAFLRLLQHESEILTVEAPVDPYLEITEIS